jgi:hypothetical protein
VLDIHFHKNFQIRKADKKGYSVEEYRENAGACDSHMVKRKTCHFLAPSIKIYWSVRVKLHTNTSYEHGAVLKTD